MCRTRTPHLQQYNSTSVWAHGAAPLQAEQCAWGNAHAPAAASAAAARVDDVHLELRSVALDANELAGDDAVVLRRGHLCTVGEVETMYVRSVEVQVMWIM